MHISDRPCYDFDLLSKIQVFSIEILKLFYNHGQKSNGTEPLNRKISEKL